MAVEAPQSEIEVQVSFPISKHGPYNTKVTPETIVGTVLAEAMQHFQVQDDSQFTYVLSHGGQEQINTTTIGALAGHAHEVRFLLVKEIAQG